MKPQTRYYLRATLRHAKRALECFTNAAKSALSIPTYEPPDFQTAFVSPHPTPDHPSQLCDCKQGPIDHSPTCAAFPFLCAKCAGTGWCDACHGDGCSPKWGEAITGDDALNDSALDFVDLSKVRDPSIN